MTRDEKISQLRRLIETRLGGYIDRNYVLLGLPYYLNVGDILIWEGEKQFLRTTPYKCLNKGYHYTDYSKIRDDTLIVLQGGGNFGDLWRFVQDERLNIIKRFQNNRIIITPVTCWYENTELLRQDAEVFSMHPNLTICARDALSFDLLQKYFNNTILLVPDMAFCIENAPLRRQIYGVGDGTLFLKRNDKELSGSASSQSTELPCDADVRDWPSMEKDPRCWIRYQKLCNYGYAIGQYGRLWRLSRMVLKSSDWYYHNQCRKQIIQDGVRFLARYRNIYTTRLHVGILAILLDKEVTILDNSYGKNAGFFASWLHDVSGVKLLKPL